jgi:hypothetical protein
LLSDLEAPLIGGAERLSPNQQAGFFNHNPSIEKYTITLYTNPPKYSLN